MLPSLLRLAATCSYLEYLERFEYNAWCYPDSAMAASSANPTEPQQLLHQPQQEAEGTLGQPGQTPESAGRTGEQVPLRKRFDTVDTLPHAELHGDSALPRAF